MAFVRAQRGRAYTESVAPLSARPAYFVLVYHISRAYSIEAEPVSIVTCISRTFMLFF